MKRVLCSLLIIVSLIVCIPASANNKVLDLGDGRELVWAYENYENGMSITVAYFVGGEKVWDYVSATYQYAMVDSISDCYVNNNTMYLVENGTLKAFSIETGKVKWSAEGCGTTDMVFDEWGNIYTCSFDGVKLSVVSPDGVLLHTDKSSDFHRVFDLKIEGNTLYIYAEEGPYYNEEENCSIIPFDISIFANAEIKGYKDVLSTLSQKEKTALFNDFLCAFSGYDVDYRIVDDYTLLEEILPTARIESPNVLGLEIGYENPPYGRVSKQELDKLTSSIFGRVFDGNDFKYENMPPEDQIGDGYFFWKDGEWLYQSGAGRGVGGGDGYPKHLYNIGNGYYYAVQEVVWFTSAGDVDSRSMYAYIIKQNNDNSYKLIRTYSEGVMLTTDLIDTIVNPSDWAKSEIEAADNANLIPSLDGEPLWKDSATRLQFAQLAVNLAEMVTGKTLTSAPNGTFTDSSDAAVLKAYKAGIVNGVSKNEFAPDQKLTREQLATMLWRTIDYIQNTTKKENLKASNQDISGYFDANDVSDYAKEAVAKLASAEIMRGTSETELSPKSDCAVEQSVILVYRTFMKIK